MSTSAQLYFTGALISALLVIAIAGIHNSKTPCALFSVQFGFSVTLLLLVLGAGGIYSKDVWDKN